jgi:hypothetical protein
LPLVDARRALLQRLFDHAPLFPPASMSLPDALEEDRRAQAAFVRGCREVLGDAEAGSCSFFEPVGELRELGFV